MTKGAWMCRQQDDGLKIWYVPRQNDKPCTDSERAQKWRLSLASLLFFTVLLSDHLWLCAEANLTRTRDQEQGTLADMGEDPTAANYLLSPLSLRPEEPRNTISSGKHGIFIGNTTRPIWQIETCHPHCISDQCVSVEDAESICGSASAEASVGSSPLSFSNFHLSFCESYTLSELFAGMSTPEGLNCDLSRVMDGDATVCVQCVETYQRLDQHAQEKYEEFQILFQKYLPSGEYSVKSCIDDCKAQQQPQRLDATPDAAEADAEEDLDPVEPKENIFQSDLPHQENGGDGEGEDEAPTLVLTLEEVVCDHTQRIMQVNAHYPESIMMPSFYGCPLSHLHYSHHDKPEGGDWATKAIR
uniref:NALCN channel auxiliary factor 1-like n=1 Tax=Pristiophorus japonicus TaxID=55135 RepID=UPI00398EA4E0